LQNGGARFKADKALITTDFPTLEFRADEVRKRIFLEGNLELQTRCGIPTAIRTGLEFPWDYPQSEPVAFDVSRRFKALPQKDLKDRHISGSGQCCLWLRPKSPWNANNPDALREFLVQLVVFFDRQLIYDLTGEWPGPAYRHEKDGYLEFIQEELGAEAYLFPFFLRAITKPGSVERNEPCPCGSHKKYKHCHMGLIQKIQQRIGFDQLLMYFGNSLTMSPQSTDRSEK